MKLSQAFSIAALAGSALAHPFSQIDKRQNIDLVVLQFALTLEHLENVFYEGAIANFSVGDFEAAGYSATYYNNLKYIGHDEQVHVQALSAAITAAGATPVAACQYKFPYTDVASFITLSSVLEGVGTSAYLGGAPLISSKAYLTVAGSILVTEALHTSYQRAAKGEVPMANPFGTPLDPTSVFTLAAMFIVSCPSSNMALPFVPFPTLTYDGQSCTCEEPDCQPDQAIKKRQEWASTVTESAWGYAPSSGWESPSRTYYSESMPYSSEVSSYSSEMPTYTSEGPKPTMTADPYCSPPPAGATIMLTAAKDIPSGSFVTFVSGLNVVSVQGKIEGADIYVAIPAVAMGQTYVFITSMDVEGALVDGAVLFGPAIVEVDPPAPVIDYSILKA